MPHDAFIRQTSSRSRGTGLKEQEIKSVTIKASVIGVVHGSGALGLDHQYKTNGVRGTQFSSSTLSLLSAPPRHSHGWSRCLDAT